MNISYSIVKDYYMAEDVSQIIILKIIEMPKCMLPESNELSWLYTITKNQSIDYIRKNRSNIDLDEIYDIQERNSKIQEVVDIDYYNRIIGFLNEKEKEIVSLKILSNFTFKEIGQILNIPTATAQWRYYKSVHSLKLLISNLTLLIIAFTLLIKNVENNIINNNREINNNVLEDKSELLKDGKKENTITESSLFDNFNYKEGMSIQNDSSNFVNNSTILYLSFSSIFLIFSITIGIICVKHKKKRQL